MFAYDSRSDGEASFKAEVEGIGPSASAGVWGRWVTAQSIHTNRGPIMDFPSSTSAGILSAIQLAANSDPLTEYNQCVFIKGFRVRFRIIPWSIKAAAGPHVPDIGEDQDEGGFSDALIMDMDAAHELDVSESAKASHNQGTYLSLTSCPSKSNQLFRGNGGRDRNRTYRCRGKSI
jgi:hypothetical protein